MEQTTVFDDSNFLNKEDLVNLFIKNRSEIVEKENERNKGTIDFDAMLNSAANVLALKNRIPDEIDYPRHESVYAFLNKKPKHFQTEIVKHIISSYYMEIKKKNRLPLHHQYEKSKKLTKEQLVSINVAFGIVSGHSYSSFLNVLKSKVYEKFGRETLKALNYLKISNLILSHNIDYQQCLDKEPLLVEKLKSENAALFYPSVLLVGFKGLNQYKELKEALTKSGLTKKGWKNMCNQTANYNLRAMRKRKLGAFCLNNGLKDAWLRNRFVSKWFTFENLKNKEQILLKEIENYNGHVNKFEPFPIVVRQGFMGIECVQLSEIDDYLRATPADDSKTLAVLYRRSTEWHENSYKSKKGHLFNYKKREVTTFDESGYKFEQILDSHKLYEEGKTMHHCVFSYSDRCSRENYLVYQVFGEGKDEKDVRATLGITINSEPQKGEKISNKYIFNQMYGHCNRSVSDEMHKAAKLLIKKLNAEYKEKNQDKVKGKKSENIKLPLIHEQEMDEVENEVYF